MEKTKKSGRSRLDKNCSTVFVGLKLPKSMNDKLVEIADELSINSVGKLIRISIQMFFDEYGKQNQIWITDDELFMTPAEYLKQLIESDTISDDCNSVSES